MRLLQCKDQRLRRVKDHQYDAIDAHTIEPN
jgi:hypothetical protein